jgi:uncharacterized repeat protein (TIGR01451 family)
MKRAVPVLVVGVLAVLLAPSPAFACVCSADLTISATASSEPVTADAELTYTITVTNNGPDPADHTTIIDTLPPDVMFVSASGKGELNTAVSPPQIRWYPATLENGESVVRSLVIRPIHPDTITNSVTVTTSSTDPTVPDTAQTATTVVPEPGVQYISVRDDGLVPSFHEVPLGGTLQWDFFGPGVHEIMDAHGLGLIDTGPVQPVTYVRHTFNLSAEIRTMDVGYPANNGKLVVPVEVSPSSGTTATTFTVQWALAPLPSRFVEDVQIKRPTATRWQPFRHATSTLSAAFTPDAGAGTYAFRDRVRNQANDTHSRFGPPVEIQVSA